VLTALRLRARRHRTAVTIAASIAASVALGLLLIGKWDELETGVTGAPIAIAAAAVALQVVALVSCSEAWHVCVHAAGGAVGRRTLYRASSMGFVGGAPAPAALPKAQLARLALVNVGREAAKSR
jgi:hypothetical protein